MAIANTAGRTTSGKRSPQVVGITSGKGGVGKTNIAVNLALAFAKSGRRVLLVDADLGLANVDILLDERPRLTLSHVMDGSKSLHEVLMPTRYGVTVLPGASGVQSVADATTAQRQRLVSAIETLGEEFDTVVVDTAAGIATNTLFFAAATHDIIVVTTPEPTALTDAYATIKVLSQRYGIKRVHLLLNQAPDDMAAREVFVRLSALAARFLPVAVEYVGRIPSDPKVRESVMQRQPVLAAYPHAPASIALKEVAQQLIMRADDVRANGGMQLFWSQLVGYADGDRAGLVNSTA